VSTPASLLDDLRQLERLAAAAGADDRWLGEAISRLTLLCLGVPITALAAYQRAEAAIAAGSDVRRACACAGMSPSRFYELRRRVCGFRGHVSDGATIPAMFKQWRR
jgi:hypothetical protein